MMQYSRAGEPFSCQEPFQIYNILQGQYWIIEHTNLSHYKVMDGTVSVFGEVSDVR